MLSHNYYFIFLYLIHSSLYVYIYRIDVIHSLTSVPTVLTEFTKSEFSRSPERKLSVLTELTKSILYVVPHKGELTFILKKNDFLFKMRRYKEE